MIEHVCTVKFLSVGVLAFYRLFRKMSKLITSRQAMNNKMASNHRYKQSRMGSAYKKSLVGVYKSVLGYCAHVA